LGLHGLTNNKGSLEAALFYHDYVGNTDAIVSTQRLAQRALAHNNPATTYSDPLVTAYLSTSGMVGTKNQV
jgi:hypothetical protein